MNYDRYLYNMHLQCARLIPKEFLVELIRIAYFYKLQFNNVWIYVSSGGIINSTRTEFLKQLSSIDWAEILRTRIVWMKLHGKVSKSWFSHRSDYIWYTCLFFRLKLEPTLKCRVSWALHLLHPLNVQTKSFRQNLQQILSSTTFITINMVNTIEGKRNEILTKKLIFKTFDV